MEEEYKVESTILHLDFPAILKAHKEVTEKSELQKKPLKQKLCW